MSRYRSSVSQDGWLRDYFSSRTAGAEFMLPWFMDTCFTATARLKALFTEPELKTVIEAHRNILLDTSHLRLAHLLLQVSERCEREGLHKHYGVELAALENKFRQLNDTEAAVLILWAASFWHVSSCNEAALDRYLSPNGSR